MNGNDTFLDVNNAHLRVTSGNVYASAFNLDQIDIVMSSNTASTVNFNNPTKAYNAASNIEVGTANLFVDTTTTRVGVGTASPATTLDVAGDLNVSGNLTIIGTRTTLDTEHLMVKDPIIELGKGNTASPVVDLGLVMTRPSGSSNVGIIFDESESTLEIGYTQGNASDSTITMQSAATEPLSVNVNGSLSAAKDQDVTSYLGRAAIGYNGTQSDQATFAHVDHNSDSNFAIRQTNAGKTILNSAAGERLNFNINNSTKASVESNGDFKVDTDTLYVDSVNDRVGIGTNAPSHALNVKATSGDAEVHIQAQGNDGGDAIIYFNGSSTNQRKCAIISSNVAPNAYCKQDLHFCMETTNDLTDVDITDSKMVLTNAGNVGIGTTSPDCNLEIYGDTSSIKLTRSRNNTNYGCAVDFALLNSANEKFTYGRLSGSIADNTDGSEDGFLSFQVGTNGNLQSNYQEEKMRILSNGNVGIGTSTPRTNLHIGQQLNSQGDKNTIPAAGLGISANFPSSTHAWFAHRVNATGDEYWGLAVGTIYSGSSYLQNLNKNSGTYYNLLLQPNGGNVGIGTSSPQDKLHTDIIRIGDWNGGGNGYKFFMDTNAYLRLQYMTGQTVYKDIMTLRYDNGNVGIGTTIPGAKLDVKGEIKLSGSTSGGYILSTNSTGSQLNFTHGSYSWGKWSNAHHYDVYSASDFTGSRDLYLNYYSGAPVRLVNGTAVSSDDRIKTNERYITNATETLLKLKPQIYDKGPSLGGGTGETRVESGLIVQDIYYDAPELRHLVHYDEDAEIPDEKPYVDDDPQKDPDYSMWGTKSAGLNYEGFIAYLIKSNQELHARIDALENA